MARTLTSVDANLSPLLLGRVPFGFRDLDWGLPLRRGLLFLPGMLVIYFVRKPWRRGLLPVECK